MFEWLLLSNYCAIVAQTIYAWRQMRGRMGMNNVLKLGEQMIHDSFDEETRTFTDPESWPSISNVTPREISRCVDNLKFPRPVREVIMEWAGHGRDLKELYELSKRHEWEMGYIPYARYLQQREVDNDILTSLQSLIEFCERYMKATSSPSSTTPPSEDDAFSMALFADGVDGIMHRVAISKISTNPYIYPDVRMFRAYLDKGDGGKGKDEEVPPPPQVQEPSQYLFFQSNIMKTHYMKCIPFLQCVIAKSGHSISTLSSMLHDIYCNLHVRDTHHVKHPRVISNVSLDALLGTCSKYGLRRRGVPYQSEDPRMIREGETIRLPLKNMFPSDRGVHPPRARAVHILSSVRIGMRNDGIYCVSIERQEKGKYFALKVKIGTSPHYQDMLPIYRLLEETIVGISNDGYIHTYENVTWNIPFVDGGVNFTISEWIDGKFLGDVIREKKISAPDCPYCTMGSIGPDAAAKACREHRDIRYYLSILRSLYRMHCRGVAHMDVHPQNIIVHEVRGPVLLDVDDAVIIPDEIDWRKYCLRDIRDASYMFHGFIYQQDFMEAFPLWDFDDPRPPHTRREGYKEDEAVFERIITQLRWNRWSNQLAFPETLFLPPTHPPALDEYMTDDASSPTPPPQAIPPSSLSLTISEDLLLTKTSSDVEFYMRDEAMLSELDITSRHSLVLF